MLFDQLIDGFNHGAKLFRGQRMVGQPFFQVAEIWVQRFVLLERGGDNRLMADPTFQIS
jgi:hypothetical protein